MYRPRPGMHPHYPIGYPDYRPPVEGFPGMHPHRPGFNYTNIDYTHVHVPGHFRRW